MTTASYWYPNPSVPISMCLALIALCLFTSWMLGYARPWESQLSRASVIFGVVATAFMVFAAATG